ncbi:MAG: DUF928 domain-containing protein [Myxococcota bacterium]|jgi:hypothetical protein|nr:DUF928 domain-containing protein [Myxococcota bacterium]
MTDNTDDTRRRSEGLGLLLADVMASDDSERENLVCYAEDPTSLDAEERRTVEARLASDPGWQDRLSMLQNFDASAAEPSALEGVDENVVPLSQGRPRSRFAWVAVAAAAGLMAVALIPLLTQPEDEGGPLVKREVLDHRAPGDVAPRDLPHSVPSSEAPTSIALDDVAKPPQLDSMTDFPEPQRTATEALEQGSEVPSEIVASNPSEALRDVADDSANADDQALLVAQLDPIDIPVAYRAPAEFLSRDVPRDIVRGAANGPTLVSWVPDHVAHSATSQPTLYWTLSGSLPEASQVGVVLTAEDAAEPLYEGVHPVDATRERQQTALSSLGVSLEPGEIYRWSVFVRVVDGDPSADRIAQGWVEYRAPSDDFAARVADEPRNARAAAYAEQGYWYDALALLVDIDAQHPDRAKAREQLTGFLAEAGIASASD